MRVPDIPPTAVSGRYPCRKPSWTTVRDSAPPARHSSRGAAPKSYAVGPCHRTARAKLRTAQAGPHPEAFHLPSLAEESAEAPAGTAPAIHTATGHARDPSPGGPSTIHTSCSWRSEHPPSFGDFVPLRLEC